MITIRLNTCVAEIDSEGALVTLAIVRPNVPADIKLKLDAKHAAAIGEALIQLACPPATYIPQPYPALGKPGDPCHSR